MKHFAVIVAGGSGQRMHSEVPKQFLLLAGRPVLMHTVERFTESGCQVVVVLPGKHIAYWQQLCVQYQFDLPHTVAEGGGTRIESVMNGLQHVPADALVAVHDGVRPLVRKQMIDDGFRMAEEKGSAVPVVPLSDSIRQLTAEGSRSLSRDGFRLVQTPQIFRAAELKKAYALMADDERIELLTDDASVFEAAGGNICLYEGEPTNIKITTPSDLILAESYYAQYQRL